MRSPTPIINKAVNTREEMTAMLESVSANPATVEFPRDTWGFTSELKKHALRAAASVNGSDDKQQLLMDTLAVLVKHVVARFPKDKEFRDHLNSEKARLATEVNSRAAVFGLPAPIVE